MSFFEFVVGMISVILALAVADALVSHETTNPQKKAWDRNPRLKSPHIGT